MKAEWFATAPRSRTESVGVEEGIYRRKITWRGQIVRNPSAAGPSAAFCCETPHRIKRAAVECAERESRRRNKAARL